jgi:predicted PurR-regulated permease PerM
MPLREHLQITGGALKSWAIAQLQDSLAVGVLWWIGLTLLHVPLAPLWAVFAALLQIVPHIGPVLSLIGPVTAAWIRHGRLEDSLYVLMLYAGIVLVDGFLLHLGLAAGANCVGNPDSVLGSVNLGATTGSGLCL